MLSDKMKNELIRLAKMETCDEKDQMPDDYQDHEIDGQIELAREVLDDLGIEY